MKNFSRGLTTQQELFSSPEGFLDLASQPPAPGSKEAIKMTVGSGRKLYASLEKSSPLGRFSRILLESETWASPEYYLTWKVKATKCGCLVFQLAPSAPRRSGNGISSWPTVTKEDQKTDNVGDRMYREAVENGEPIPTTAQRLRSCVAATWSTPREGKTTAEDMETWQKRKDAGGVAIPPLGALVNTWPTVRTRCTATKSRPQDKFLNMETVVPGIASSGCLALTEKFVVRLTTLSAWLMGYTGAYLRLWEIQSSRKLLMK